MKNTPRTGIVYHVVDKITGEVVKVGSTIASLSARFRGHDYKKKYTNHFLREVKKIESSELDWYEANNPLCPFLWHLVASEHREMLRVGTFRKGLFSNQVSPLDQKFGKLDGSVAGRAGGCIVGGSKEGRARMSVLGKSIPHEERVRRARVSGMLNVTRGRIPEMCKAALGKGGLIGGRINAESGHCARIAHLGGLAGGRKGSEKTNHIRWHVRRGIVSTTCELCK